MGDFEGLVKNRMVKDAIIRELEIIGEAAKNVSQDFREKYKEIPWKDMAGMRDKLIHEYFGVDINIVWKVITKELPALKEKIEEVLQHGQ